MGTVELIIVAPILLLVIGGVVALIAAQRRRATRPVVVPRWGPALFPQQMQFPQQTPFPQQTGATGWHPDPTGRHELRYFDGATWTRT